jgi:hypothetical protein
MRPVNDEDQNKEGVEEELEAKAASVEEAKERPVALYSVNGGRETGEDVDEWQDLKTFRQFLETIFFQTQVYIIDSCYHI